jgi:hypothetical protein
MGDKLTWKKVSRQTCTAPVGDGYYEIIEHRAGKWGCKLSHLDSSGERGAYVPDARTYFKTLDEAKAACESHWARQPQQSGNE